MRRTFLLLVATALLAIAAVALAPASVAGIAVERATRGAMTLAAAEGSVWRGRAVLVGSGEQLRLAWTIDALPLLLGTARVHLAPWDGTADVPRGTLAVGFNRIGFTDALVRFPAAMLAGGTRSLVHPSGEMTFASKSFEWNPPGSAGALDVTWKDARIGWIGGSADLGSLRTNLVGKGDRAQGGITNEGGEIDVSGDVSLIAPSVVDVAVVLRPRAGADTPIAHALAAFGTPENGGWRIHWRGDLK